MKFWSILLIVPLILGRNRQLSEKDIDLSEEFEIRGSTGKGELNEGRLAVNIGSPVTYLCKSSLLSRLRLSTKDTGSVSVTRHDGSVMTTSRVLQDAHLRLGGHGSYLSHLIMISDSRCPNDSAGELGLGPRTGLEWESDSYDAKDFVLFRNAEDKMQILFTYQLDSMYPAIHSDICIRGLVSLPALPEYLRRGKYSLMGTVGLDKQVAPSEPIPVVFESIYKFIELPTDSYEELLAGIQARTGMRPARIQNGHSSIVLDGCKRSVFDRHFNKDVNRLPNIKMTIGAKNFYSHAGHYIEFFRGLASAHQCLLHVRPQSNSEYLVAGQLFLTRSVLAVQARNSDHPSIVVCES